LGNLINISKLFCKNIYMISDKATKKKYY